MKILLFTTRFYPHVGGVERVVEDLAHNLSKKHEVCVLTSKLSPGLKNSLNLEDPVVDRNGYKIKRIWVNLPRKFLGYLGLFIRFSLSTFYLVRFVRNYKPDVINLHFLDDVSPYAYILMLFVKVPLIVNIHGNDLHVFSKKTFYRFFINKLLMKARKVIVNSEYMKLEILKVFKAIDFKLVIVGNGLNVDKISKVKPRRYFSDPYIFFVGRIVHKKGVDILIEAFQRAKLPKCKLLIEGSGEQLIEMKSLVNSLKISDAVVFTDGKLDEETKNSYLKGAVFGVMPSRIEPFGIVALEFLAAGVPVIASKTGGLKYLLKDKKTCVFFENGNVIDLASKIKDLFNNEKLRVQLVKNGIKEVKRYDNYEVSKKYETIFLKEINA